MTIEDLMQQSEETERLISVYRNASEVVVGTQDQIYSGRGLIKPNRPHGRRDRRSDRQYPRAAACGDAETTPRPLAPHPRHRTRALIPARPCS